MGLNTINIDAGIIINIAIIFQIALSSLKDIALIMIAFAYVLTVLGIAMVLKKKKIISGHIARKIVHLLAGFAIFIVPFLQIPHLALIVAILFLIVCRISKPSTPVFELMAEKNERELGYLGGPFYYALAINILVFIFAFDPFINYFYFPANSIMIMMIADSIAAFIGRKFGKHQLKLSWTHTIRTIEGSIGMFISSFLLSIFGFTFFGVWFPLQLHVIQPMEILFLSLIVSICATFIELLSPSNLDDLTVPLFACFISLLIVYLFFPSIIGV
ncbi:MAG: diacylglycerol/polyprenol kinase family protein [Promethearchaeota archaeon]